MHQEDQRPRKFVWPLQAMPLARAISLSYAFLITYVSLNPFDFNFSNGIAPWAWLDAPLPRFITLFDLSVNVLAYIPLGFLLVFASYPRWRNFVALSIALSFSAGLAFSVESLQTWLPTRIPSQMDWWANVLGGLMGGLLAIPLGPQWLSGSVIRRRFDQWFGVNWAACALFLLFPWAQIYPQSSWLGTGVWGHAIFASVDWGTMVINHVIQESIITAVCWLGTGPRVVLHHCDKIFAID
jgi:VanZ family protein